ncbi:DNA-directed RNA polymerase subunit F [Candidatus Marsarchaeota archaeon]|nr:DNA-directed RNA polymerase subunit F [Candidatus Marsarchaeota archaeon]MCL5404319.1 DNA-directed RNA polymerase subunit F [Candidatus Marsarchaeota archaeon]
MIGKKAEQNGFITLDEVYEILKERKKSPKPLTYEQQLAYEYVEKFKLPKKHTEKAKSDLQKLGILSDYAVAKLIEVMPKNAGMVRQILAKEKGSIDDSAISKILEITTSKG